MPVGVVQRERDLAGDPDRGDDGKPPLADEPLAQRLVGDVGHDVVEQPSRLARIEERQDVGMGEPGDEVDLAQKPLGADRAARSWCTTLRAHRRSCRRSWAR